MMLRTRVIIEKGIITFFMIFSFVGAVLLAEHWVISCFLALIWLALGYALLDEEKIYIVDWLFYIFFILCVGLMIFYG